MSTRIENQSRNNIISTTKTNNNNEQLLVNLNKNSSTDEGQIECMGNGRRFILKNSKWFLLCEYDDVCLNTAKYESLCKKHFELTHQKQHMTLKYYNSDNGSSRSSILDNRRTNFSNSITKHLKTNGG